MLDAIRIWFDGDKDGKDDLLDRLFQNNKPMFWLVAGITAAAVFALIVLFLIAFG